MKTSDKILINSGIIVILVITLLIISAKFIVNRQKPVNDQKISSGSGKIIEKDFQPDGFSGISISGGWEVEINSGGLNQYKVSIQLPEAESDNLNIYKEGKLLNIKYKMDKFDRVKFQKGGYKIKVIMPEINRIELSGGTDVSFSGFHSGNLDIIISGGCKLNGSSNTIGNLSINSSGASYIGLGRSSVTNAGLRISGLCSIQLNMAGGELTGNASGAVTILYSGYVSRQNIRQSGIVSIVKR